MNLFCSVLFVYLFVCFSLSKWASDEIRLFDLWIVFEFEYHSGAKVETIFFLRTVAGRSSFTPAILCVCRIRIMCERFHTHTYLVVWRHSLSFLFCFLITFQVVCIQMSENVSVLAKIYAQAFTIHMFVQFGNALKFVYRFHLTHSSAHTCKWPFLKVKHTIYGWLSFLILVFKSFTFFSKQCIMIFAFFKFFLNLFLRATSE